MGLVQARPTLINKSKLVCGVCNLQHNPLRYYKLSLVWVAHFTIQGCTNICPTVFLGNKDQKKTHVSSLQIYIFFSNIFGPKTQLIEQKTMVRIGLVLLIVTVASPVQSPTWAVKLVCLTVYSKHIQFSVFIVQSTFSSRLFIVLLYTFVGLVTLLLHSVCVEYCYTTHCLAHRLSLRGCGYA